LKAKQLDLGDKDEEYKLETKNLEESRASRFSSSAKKRR